MKPFYRNRPFGDKQMYAFVDLASTLHHEAVGENMQFKEYAILFQKVNFPAYISPAAQDLLTGLLDVNDATRLGTGPMGYNNIKKHPFFHGKHPLLFPPLFFADPYHHRVGFNNSIGLDWDLLEQKQIEPPFKPPRHSDSERYFSQDLKSLLGQYGKESYMVDTPPDDKQKYFDNW